MTTKIMCFAIPKIVSSCKNRKSYDAIDISKTVINDDQLEFLVDGDQISRKGHHWSIGLALATFPLATLALTGNWSIGLSLSTFSRHSRGYKLGCLARWSVVGTSGLLGQLGAIARLEFIQDHNGGTGASRCCSRDIGDRSSDRARCLGGESLAMDRWTDRA